MAYVAVSGGEETIEASLALLRQSLMRADCQVSVAAIEAALPELVDQVMGEGSLYSPTLAALALKQGGGSVEEAVFLLRAFRSTLERPYISRSIDTANMLVERRISASFKDLPGGQILGITRDYSHRLLDFSLAGRRAGEEDGAPGPSESPGEGAAIASHGEGTAGETEPAQSFSAPPRPAGAFERLPRVSAFLAEQGLLTRPLPDDTEPHDLTMEPLSFPAPRSICLQALARGMTQGVMTLGYAAIRGFGQAHPTVGELRFGSLPILIDHPQTTGAAASEEDAYYVGAIAVTECESLFSVEGPEKQRLPENPELPACPENHKVGEGCELEFGIGYGLVYGRAESKAIAMSVLDFCLDSGDNAFPTQDQEFVLYHIDGVEATGFISHLKLPHYVTFQSKLNSTRRTHGEAVTGPQGSASADSVQPLEAAGAASPNLVTGEPHASLV
ncbi:MAG: carbon-phosphorus lyase complex subunit PhnI [Coriobacteriales bacterium]|jgi:alpha-D-ribose 1-methylphosphonate 5-triphosphate synthase subunit PhnI|nr:carbon-phosphorus lyase complex subunit PhnI [Coriobacteriales bacterium]